MNFALLGKLIWKLLTDCNSFRVKIFKHKYFNEPRDTWFNSRKGSSYIWQSLTCAKHLLREGFRWQLGNGHSFLWYVPLSELGKLYDLVPFIHISDAEAVVRDVWNDKLWDFSCIWTPLPDSAKQSIGSLPILSHVDLDNGWV